MDIKKIALEISKPKWTFTTSSGVIWNVHPYSTNASIEIERATKSDGPSSGEIVKTLIQAICSPFREGEELPDSENPVDMSILTTEDLDSFSSEFIANNSNLVEGVGSDFERLEDDSDTDYLAKLLVEYNRIQVESLKATFSNLNKSLFGLSGSANSAISQLSKGMLGNNASMEDHFASIRSDPHIPDFSIADIPPNPIYDTNSHLRDVTRRLDSLLEFGENALQIMNGLQVAALEFLENFSVEADKTSYAAKRAIYVGSAAVIIAIAQMAYTEFWRVPNDKADMDAAIAKMKTEIDDLQSELSKLILDGQQAQIVSSEAMVGAIKDSGEENGLVLGRIELLLIEQNVQSNEMLSKLAPPQQAIVPSNP